jgi:hypothetical protein
MLKGQIHKDESVNMLKTPPLYLTLRSPDPKSQAVYSA